MDNRSIKNNNLTNLLDLCSMPHIKLPPYFTVRRFLSHTKRTAESFRQPNMIRASVHHTQRLSPTVKSVYFECDSPVNFKAGQW